MLSVALAVLVSVLPIVSVLPEEAPKSISTLPLLLKLPVTASVKPGSTIPKVAEAVVSEIEPTITGVVSETVPKEMTASSPGPGTVPVSQSIAVFQLPASSIQVFVAIVQYPSPTWRGPNEAHGRFEGETCLGTG